MKWSEKNTAFCDLYQFCNVKINDGKPVYQSYILPSRIEDSIILTFEVLVPVPLPLQIKVFAVQIHLDTKAFLFANQWKKLAIVAKRVMI